MAGQRAKSERMRLSLAKRLDVRCYPYHRRGKELYEQLTPTKVYTVHMTGTTQGDVSCRMCGKSPETWARAIGVLCLGTV